MYCVHTLFLIRRAPFAFNLDGIWFYPSELALARQVSNGLHGWTGYGFDTMWVVVLAKSCSKLVVTTEAFDEVVEIMGKCG